MSDLLISVPIWGAPYVRMFAEVAAPALLAAVQRLGAPVKFLIHTDAPAAVQAALPGQQIEVRPVAAKSTYEALQNGHAEAVRCAAPGDRVVLLNADLVVSGNLLERCAEHAAAGVEAVVLLGIRTAAGPEKPPAGAAPRDLLTWAWAHRHQIIRDLEWGRGGSMLPTNLFWEVGGSVVARGFHLHPVMIVKHPNTDFKSTIDGDLLDCFSRDKIRVVVDPDDCSMLEVSPPERRFPVRPDIMTVQGVAASMRSRASATHCWLFGAHRIGVCGSAEDVREDTAIAGEVLGLLGGPSSYPAPRRGSRPQRGREPARR